MSILSKIEQLLSPITTLLFDPHCRVCGEQLSSGQRFVCTQCRYEMPMTNYQNQGFNPMIVRIQELRPEIIHASSLIFYGGGWRKLIHQIKYSGEWYIASKMGRWLGDELSRSPLYQGIDMVVGVPLHPRRQFTRGYNQSLYIAQGVAQSMGIKCVCRGVSRVRYNTSQVQIKRSERWRNVESLFKVTNPKLFKGKRILLVDDVYTTGATMISFAETILNAVPDAKILIATLAISRSEFGLDERK